MTGMVWNNFSPAALLNHENPSVATTSIQSRHGWGRAGKRVQQPGPTSFGTDRSQVNDDGVVLVPVMGMPPKMLVNTNDFHTV